METAPQIVGIIFCVFLNSVQILPPTGWSLLLGLCFAGRPLQGYLQRVGFPILLLHENKFKNSHGSFKIEFERYLYFIMIVTCPIALGSAWGFLFFFLVGDTTLGAGTHGFQMILLGESQFLCLSVCHKLHCNLIHPYPLPFILSQKFGGSVLIKRQNLV